MKNDLETKINLDEFASKLKETLTPWEIGVVYLAGQGRNYAQIGRDIGRSRESAVQIVENCVPKLRRAYRNYSEQDIARYFSDCISSGKIEALSVKDLRKTGDERKKLYEQRKWENKERSSERIENSVLESFLSDLPEDQKFMLAMSYSGMKPTEIAKEMGCKDLGHSKVYVNIIKKNAFTRLQSRIRLRGYSLNVIDLVEQGIKRDYLRMPKKSELKRIKESNWMYLR